MSNAQNTPVQRPKREVSISDTPVTELDSVSLALDTELDRERIVVAEEGSRPDKNDLANLAFGEEPITLLINKGTEKNAPNAVHCSVNGVGAEVFMNGKWVEFQWLPVNKQLVTKRKYVEVLARAKQTSYTTSHDEPGAEYIQNFAIPSTSRAVSFNVINDPSPRGAAWLQALAAERE